MKAVADALSALRKNRAELGGEVDKLRRDAYILDQSIVAIEKASNLQRISSKRVTQPCQACGQEFTAKKAGAFLCKA